MKTGILLRVLTWCVTWQDELSPAGAAVMVEARHMAEGCDAAPRLTSAAFGAFCDANSSCTLVPPPPWCPHLHGITVLYIMNRAASCRIARKLTTTITKSQKAKMVSADCGA